jgi:N-acetylmuramic acid 6-phosphate etherase
MPTPEFLDSRLTERRNPRTVGIDVASALEIVDLMNTEDSGVLEAVRQRRGEIARAIELVVEGLRSGGRLIYVGAGTSGRLGVLDATECPPTFGTPPEMVVGIIAGGAPALTRSQEGSEDDVEAGSRAMDDCQVAAEDFVLGIAASGTTPYVGAALTGAKERGAKVGLLTCSAPPPDVADLCDVTIMVPVGPEVLTGSTIDLVALSEKLVDRSERIVMEAADVSREDARRAIEQAGGRVKVAIVMVRLGVDAEEASRLLSEAGGFVRPVAGDPPPVVG